MYIGLHAKRHHSCGVLMKPELSRQIFEKCSNARFYYSPSSGSRVVPCGRTDRQTDRHDEANSRLSQFCEGAWKRQISRTTVYWDVTPCATAERIPYSTPSEESVSSCLMPLNLYGQSHQDGNLYYHRHKKIT